jgi:predicted small metal-binding protein
MAYEFDCPDCDFTSQGNEMDPVVESAQQHVRDAHGDMPEREEVVPHISGPG